MNAFNRVCMTLFALLSVAAGVVAFLLFATVIVPSDLGLGAFVAELARGLLTVGGDSPAIAYSASGGVVLFGILLLVLELLPARRQTAFEVGTTDLGVMTVERDGLCRMAERVASSVDGVVGARAVMESRDGGVACRCLVSVHAEASVKDVGAEVQSLVRESVERQAGIQLHEVEVKARITNEPAPEPPRVVD